jgi:ADP-dependent phosphofructokinase/glucokinase
MSEEDIKNRKIIVGFNVNVDRIIELTPESIDIKLLDEFDLEFEKGKIKLPSRINSVGDFLPYLMYSMMEGKALEIAVFSKEIADWIENNFEIKNDQIGGQAGIIANLFKSIGVNDVLLSLPTQAPKLADLLDLSLLTIAKEKESYSIQEIKKVKFEDKEPISHYVFEFKAGNYRFNSLEFNCPRDNRFIFTYDEVNTLVKFNNGFHEFSENFIPKYSLAILSGFGLANEQYSSFDELFLPTTKMIENWKRINPDLYIHIELSSCFNARKRISIKNNLFPIVNSVGVNEQEIQLFSVVEKEYEEPDPNRKFISTDLFEMLHELFLQYPHLRIHLHYPGFFLVISPVMKLREAERARNALILSSFFAASKAKSGSIESYQDIYNVEIDLSSKGFEELEVLQGYLESHFEVKGSIYKTGILETPNFSLIGVPTILVKNPQKLVGLGDTISSTAILFDSND